MARLAIAKTFLTEYGRLDKDVQLAVDAAIAKFAKHPNPGAHLEKPQRSWDDRIRTLDVDGRWHGIVLAPTSGDTYCLVTILPQHKATAFATSRRFSVNPALGVLEVRDEEAMQQMRPLLEEASESEDRRLFADMSDDDLTALGIDERILPAIRLLTAEADLETRQAAFPEAQYAALHALADGMTLDEARDEVSRLYSAGSLPERVDPDDLVSAMERSPGHVTFVSGPEELRRVLAHPFATWRMFMHPSQRMIAHRASYAGPAQVTGGPGTGKTVTLLHRAAFLAGRVVVIPGPGKPRKEAQSLWRGPGDGQVLVTSFNGTLADALSAQLDLLVQDDTARRRIDVLNVDRLAYGIVKAARGAPVIADERTLRARWTEAAADTGLDLSPAFLKNEWEQVILAQDLRTEQSYLTCLRIGRGRPLTRAQRSLIWHAAQRVMTGLDAARLSTHLQLANEATHLLRQAGVPRYRHILVDEAQDLHPSQWRLLRAAVPPGPDDLFIAADPHQRIYDNRVSLTSMRISVRGRTRRLSLNYRTTKEILTWAVPLLGTEEVTGLDGEVDSLLGYESPMHGPQPRLRVAATREEEFAQLAAQIRMWLAAGIEPHAIGLTARSAGLVREAREMLKADGIATIPLSGRGSTHAVRAGTMHAMKGLEFQAVAVLGVEEGLVPKLEAITPEGEDPVANANDVQRERCVLFVACTRARDHLYVSGTGALSSFLPPDSVPTLSGADGDEPADQGEPSGQAQESPRRVSGRELLWLREDAWRPLLRSSSLVAEADLDPDHTGEVVALLGQLYASLRDPQAEGDSLLSRWPACLAAAMVAVAAADDKDAYWPALWEAADMDGTRHDREIWGHAFRTSIGRLGMAAFPELPPSSARPVLLHAGIPVGSLGAYLRLLLSRRLVDPGLDAAGFLSWVTADGHEERLSQLDERAGNFLLNGDDYAHDLVDRTLDLLERLKERDPDFGSLRLPNSLVEAARAEFAAGRLDLSAMGRRRRSGRDIPGFPAGQAQAAALPAGPRLLLGDPLPGVAAPCGSPVYAAPPRLWLPQDLGANIRWYAEVSRVDEAKPLVGRLIGPGGGDVDIWDGIARPLLGEFEVIVRGPLGRGLRRTIFVAEGLAAGYAPPPRPLTVS
ncbi:MAG TPA: UvrD-helicase domain-containing protein [Trebonia sp.]